MLGTSHWRAWLLVGLLAPTGCIGEIGNQGASGEETDPPPVQPSFIPAEATLHRLTAMQLQNSWLDLFGEPLALPSDLPGDDRLYGFSSIAAASTTIAPVDAEKYEQATYAVLDQVWSDPARRTALLGCDDASLNEACLRPFLESFLEQAWRRPAATDEVTQLLTLMSAIGADLGDPIAGVKFGLAAVLQSPHFLFRVEVGEQDPQRADLLRFTHWEMASRLSFLLADSPPDEELRQAAREGKLQDPQRVEEEARRLLALPRAKEALTRFFRDFMNVTALDTVDKSAEAFPQFSATMGASMRSEMEQIFQAVAFDPAADFRSVFSTRETFLNEELANLYGVEWTGAQDFVPVTLAADSARAGLLTTPGFLALNAHETQTSPTHRGRFVRINLLCEDIPPPPPGVSTSLPEPEPGQPLQTLRERLAQHRNDPACAACHDQMDPIGFAFEQFDAIGRFRTVDENGLMLDVETEVNGVPLTGAVEMAAYIAELPQASACIARRFYEHAGAHLATEGEATEVQTVVDEFVASDFAFQSLVVSLVTNDGFRYATPQAEETMEQGQ
jgi:hypothetical protein